jgi:hypothetical protein
VKIARKARAFVANSFVLQPFLGKKLGDVDHHLPRRTFD